MSDINFDKVKLSDLFENKRGNSLYTKKYCNINKGPYEVFTGTTIGTFGSISTYEYDKDTLTYTTDGEHAGTVRILRGKYNIGGHRASLTPIVSNLDLNYFRYILEPIFKNLVKDGSVPSITWNNIKNRKVPVPILKSGLYDLNKQSDIAQKYKIIEERKEKLISYKNTLEQCLIEANFSINYKHKEFKISELFIPKNGGMKYTKSYCNSNKGEYPIYSGSTKNVFGNISSYDYDGKYITWCIDGLAGYIKVINGKFSITNHRGILVPKDKSELLDMEYLKYIIEPIFRRHIKGRRGHDGQNEYTSLKLNAVNKIEDKIYIPTKDDGSFDLQAQQDISKKYKDIERIIKKICNDIEVLVSTGISITHDNK